MKQIALLLFLLAVPAMAHAQHDAYGSERTDASKSSMTCTADTFVVITSSSIYFYGVDVTSPSAGGEVTIFSTGTITPQTSTAAIVSNGTFGTSQRTPMVFSGLSYSKKGNACVNIRYDLLMATQNTDYNRP